MSALHQTSHSGPTTTDIPDVSFEIRGETADVEQWAPQQRLNEVRLHVSHVRMLARRFGVIAGDEEADRTIARLSRQIRTLTARIHRLAEMFQDASMRGHEDVEYECEYGVASLELATEFCTELPDAQAHREASRQAAPVPEVPPSTPGRQSEELARS